MSATRPIWLAARHLPRAELVARLAISAGTRAPSRRYSDRSFDPGARVAKPYWRHANEADMDALGLAVGRGSGFDTVGLVNLPSALLSGLREARALSVAGLRAEAVSLRDQALLAWLPELETAHRWLFDLRAARDIGFSSGSGRTAHTTIDGDSGRHIGLHLDNWDRLAPLDRWKGQNRICINLGVGARALQFVALTAADIVAALESAGRDVTSDAEALRDSTGRSDLARCFLEAFPDMPVARLTILPGEAYVAPTENLIHDGCAESSHEDLTLTVRGRITPLSDAP